MASERFQPLQLNGGTVQVTAEQVRVIATYLHDGARGVNYITAAALGIDPWQAGGYTEEAFRRRAADLLESLAGDLQQKAI